MAKVLAVLVVLACVCAQALAAPLILTASKDAIVSRYGTGDVGGSEQNFNGGGLSNQSRWNKNIIYGLVDFDVHSKTSGALYDWLVAEGFTPTGAGIKAAIDAGQLKVEFGVAQVGTQLANGANEVRTIDCIVDWKEGNGTNRYNNFGWTNTGGAATYINPQQILPSEGAAKGPGWGGNGDGLLNAVPYTKVSVADMVWNSVADSYAYATLTSEGVRQLMDESLNRGFYTSRTVAGSAPGSENGYGYQREFSSGAKAPTLVFTVVPEPATMCLLALGGLALLRRRSA